MKQMSILSLLFCFLPLTACTPDEPSNVEDNNTVTCHPGDIVFTAEGGSSVIEVSATREWSAFSDESWITLDYQASTSTVGKINVRVAQNDFTTPRNGSVVVKAGGKRAVCNISQEAAKAINYSDLCPLEGYMLVWQDEFDKDGILLGDWTYQVANAGWVNNEKQTYVEQRSPNGTPVAEVKDGILSINCFKEGSKVYSGRVYACRNKGWKYGYFEASIKLPSGKGTWPAFWMMPVNFTAWPDDGEIDIMEEVGYHPNYTSSSIHCKKYYHSIGTQKTKERYTAGAESGFHTYALEWSADYIRTYVDGKELFYFPNDGAGDKKTWPFNTPFYPILNLAWGGDWGGAQGVDESALPVSLEVDYVRVFQKP